MFFSNVTLEDASEKAKDLCWIVAINTFVMGVPIQVTQKVRDKTFDMLDVGCDCKREGFPPRVMIPHDNASDLPFYEKVLHFVHLSLFLTYRVDAYHSTTY